MKPILLIPARRAATRLPDKPLALIGDAPMITHVWRRAMEAASLIGGCDVVVACDSDAIADVIAKEGGRAVLTDANLPSGSDRIWQALQRLESDHDIIINLQGDMPTFDPAIIPAALSLLADPDVDIATLAAPIGDVHERSDPAVVKVVISEEKSPTHGRALYFSRAAIPSGDGPLYHHIGLYAYRRAALERFVALPPSPLERREKLEQLRALEAGMRIDVAIVDTVPLGVDTPETLEKARQALAKS